MDIVVDISGYIKANQNMLTLSIGEVTELSQVGQGGNAVVYMGNFNGKDIALKFLATNDCRKLERFSAEYFNMSLIHPYPCCLINYINYEILDMNGVNVPIIVMRYYPFTLKKYRDDENNINFDNVYRLFKFLLEAIGCIHKNNIIHRDIKPENILVDEYGQFVLADFGIAKYGEDFLMQPDTKTGERLGNYQFSAPEQSRKGTEPHQTMDIYALGQICQWFATGKTHRGTGREKISVKIAEDNIRVSIIDRVIDTCLANEPENRFQSVKEISEFCDNYIANTKSAWDYVHDFHDVLAKIYPKGYNKITHITDARYLKKLVDTFNEKEWGEDLWFHTGIANLYISNFQYNDKSGYVTINEMQGILKGIWLYYSDSEHNDLVILDMEALPPFVIDGRETMYMSAINDKYEVCTGEVDGGYFIDVETESIEINKRVDFSRLLFGRYYVLGTTYNCSLNSKNDKYIQAIQDTELNEVNVRELLSKIIRNKHREIEDNM